MPNSKRFAWPIALAALFAAALVYAFWPRAVAVDVVAVTRGPMTVSVQDDGITRVKEVYVVSAPVSGRMLRIETHAGDPIVAQQTVLAMIEPADPAFRDARAQRELRFAADAARAGRDLAAANVKGRAAELMLARKERDRTKQLFERALVARAPLDQADAQLAAAAAALDTARAALRQRDFELRTAQASLILPNASGHARTTVGNDNCCYVIRAPIDGRMLRLLQENEAVVQLGQPIAEVGDPRKLEVVVDLLSSEAVQVAEGDTAIITRWGGTGVLRGRVRRIEPIGVTKVSSLGIEEQRVNVIVELTDPYARWQRLGHGYQVDVAIVRWRGANVLRVPIGALFREGADWAVFRVEDDRARIATVTLGRMNDEVAEVLGGLQAGDLVVSHPGEQVADGASVFAR